MWFGSRVVDPIEGCSGLHIGASGKETFVRKCEIRQLAGILGVDA
jgi:hypothetical protein